MLLAAGTDPFGPQEAMRLLNNAIKAVPTIASDTVITGTPTQGYVLACDGGAWNNSPTSLAYQWQRGGANIPGATSSSYTLVAADIGTGITCSVTAANAAGNSLPDVSNSLGPIIAATAPSNTAVPVLTYDVTVGLVPGVTVFLSDGTWSGDPPPTFGYAITSNGVTVSTSNSYVLQNSDIGLNIGGSVAATNAAGSPTANAVAIGPVSASSGIDTTVPAPMLTVTTANNVFPPALSINLPPDFKTDTHQLRLQCSTSPTFGTTVVDDTITLSDGEANAKAKIDASLAALTTSVARYFRAWATWNGGANRTLPSPIVGHGDTSAITLTTTPAASGSPSAIQINETYPLGVTVNANKPVTLALTSGEDMGQFQVNSSAFGTAIPIAWLHDGTRTHGQGVDGFGDDTYNATFTATDYFGNTAPISVSVKVNQILTPDFGTGFTAVTSAPLSTLETSNSVVPTMTAGISYISSVSAGGDYRVSTDGGTTWGSWTAGGGASFNMQNGYAVQLRQTSSASYSTPTLVTVKIGVASASYSVTTSVAPGTAGFTYHAQNNGTSTSLTISSVAFVTGRRVVATIGSTNATAVTSTGGQTFSKVATSGRHDIWIASASSTGATETITVTFGAGTTFCGAIALSGVNLASSTPTGTSTKALVGNADPKLFDNTLTVPNPGIGLEIVRGSGSPTTITFNTGTFLGQGHVNGTNQLYAAATLPAGFSSTASFNTGLNNTADGVAAAWSQA